jgi:hypothetical protein
MKSLEDKIYREFEETIFRFHNKQVKIQLNKPIITEVYANQAVQYQLEERTELQRKLLLNNLEHMASTALL